MIISPHTELAQAQNSAHIQDREAEPTQKLKPQKSQLGVFAKILSGLTNRGLRINTRAGENAAGGDIPIEAPLAESAESVETADPRRVSNGKGKSVRAGTISVTEKTGAKKPAKTGEAEPEFPQFALSEQEKNMLHGVGRLAGQSAEQPDEHNLVQEISAEAEKKIKLNAEINSAVSVQAHPETAGETGAGLTAGEVLAAEEKGESPADGGKAKNRVNFAEIAAAGKDSAVAAAEAPIQKTDAKKTLTGEKEGKTRLEEARTRDKRRAQTEARDSHGAEIARKDNLFQVKAGAELRGGGEGTAREITLELHLPDQGRENQPGAASWETKAGQAFEDHLARELHQNFNNDIVRHASVILREGNQGTIRLALKPESLGNVKIRLEMAENKITGHIVVESEEALRAFEKEIGSLEKAFLESGFDGANLEMSLAANGGGAEQWRETEASRALPWQFAASRYDAAVEGTEIPLSFDFYRHGAGAINVLV